MAANRDSISRLKNLFALSFALCIGGIICRGDPDYLIRLSTLVFSKAPPVIWVEMLASVQVMIGAVLMFVSCHRIQARASDR